MQNISFIFPPALRGGVPPNLEPSHQLFFKKSSFAMPHPRWGCVQFDRTTATREVPFKTSPLRHLSVLFGRTPGRLQNSAEQVWNSPKAAPGKLRDSPGEAPGTPPGQVQSSPRGSSREALRRLRRRGPGTPFLAHLSYGLRLLGKRE